MIFRTDELLEKRMALLEAVESGRESETAAFSRALEADPMDPIALRSLAMEAESDEDWPRTEELAWRWLKADPLSHDAFLLIGRMLGRDPAQASRSEAYRSLGRNKRQHDPEEMDPNGSYEELSVPADEPAETAQEMAPHRLLHELWLASTNAVDQDLIDRILAVGPQIAPFLLGVLNLWGEELLDDVDDALVVRSLALLGEIGDASVFPHAVGFMGLEDETFSNTAIWAGRRLGFKAPEDVLRVMRELVPGANMLDLASLTNLIGLIPNAPGKRELLSTIEARLQEIDDREARDAVIMGLLVSSYVMEGGKGPLSESLTRKYASRLSGHDRREVGEMRREFRDHSQHPVLPEDATTVYDICCQEFEPHDEDDLFDEDDAEFDEDGEEAEDGPLIAAPKPGRNDPCWCGSGKKYKKCHLDADGNQ